VTGLPGQACAEGPFVLLTEGPLSWENEVGVDGFEPPTSAL
jgi:hypothetical protein